MFTITLSITADVLSAGSVPVVMYGQLLTAYTPSSGPSAGTPLSAMEWVYYAGSDYAAVAGLTTVPAFATYTTSNPPTGTLTLPDVYIQAAHMVFGVGTLPPIVVNSANEPQQPDPAATDSIYDFVEFTYNTAGALYINTTMIDQFGLPIQIQIEPSDASLPNGAGVCVPRLTVMSQYPEYVANLGGSYLAYQLCAVNPFHGTNMQRLCSPNYAVIASSVQGVVANPFTGPTSTLPLGSYYYVVTALNGSVEAYAQSDLVIGTLTPTEAGEAINVAWAPNSSQPAGTTSYNVYRGTPSGSSVTWALIGNVLAENFQYGCAYADYGQAGAAVTPNFNPLTTYFDSEIQTFFANRKKTALTLTATDGTPDGYFYTFTGLTGADSSGFECLQMLLTSVVDSSGDPVASPPIPLQTPFNIYYPFWQNNTYDWTNPAPPSWEVYSDVPASVMVLAAEGVFADNSLQQAFNLPPNVPADDAAIYGVLLGGLENQIVAAITRGIANQSGSPLNWGGATLPVQLPPATVAGTSTLPAGTTQYYVITAVNANGESFPSFEFSATPTAGEPCVQLNWQPMSPATTGFNIYRGTASQQENVLVATVAASVQSYIDTGSVSSNTAPPTYFPAGQAWSVYDAFFHQPSVSLNGAAYAGPFDDQGGQSSTLSTGSPTAVTISIGPWK